MIDLQGKVALVTGGARGIGAACAIRLAEAGADVIVNYVTSQSAALETVKKIRTIGRNSAMVKADVGMRDDVESMMEFIKDKFGGLNILVNNAATGGFRPLLVTTDRNFEGAMNTNVRPLIYMVQSALTMMEASADRAKVISLSSHGANTALPMYGTIGASKAALESLSRHFALELGGRGLNFNVIRAGLVATDSTRKLPNAEQIFEGRIHKSMTGDRLLEAEDVANAVLYLASPLSDLVQGTTLIVDGGADVHL